MGNFFGDLVDMWFGSDQETRALPWATEGPGVVENYGQSQIDAYWAYIAQSQAQNLIRMGLYESGHADEMSRLQGSEDSLLSNLNALKADILAQRDQTYGNIQTEYNQQFGDIEDMADEARGTQEVSDARRGLFGSTAHDSAQRGHDKREGTAKNDLGEWRSGQRNQADNAYSQGINAGQRNYDAGISQINMQRQEADRALTSFRDQLYRENPVQMSMVPQLEYNMWNQLYATDWPGQQVVTQQATPGLFSTGLNAAISAGMGALGANAGGAAWDQLASGWSGWWNGGGGDQSLPYGGNQMSDVAGYYAQ